MTRERSRRDLLCAGSALLAGALAGCSAFGGEGGGDTSTDTTTPAEVPEIQQFTLTPAPERRLTVAHWLRRPDEQAGFDSMVAGFTESLPEIRVTPPSGSGISLTEGGLERRISRGYPPSIWQSEPGGGLGSLVDGDLLIDIESSVWDTGGLKAAYPDDVEALAGPGEGYYAMPFHGDGLANLFYNPDILDAAGVDPDAMDRPQDFLAAVETIAAETNATPLVQSTGTPWQVGHIFESVLLGQAGIEGVRRIHNQADDERVGQAIEDALAVVAPLQQYLPDDAEDIGWESAIDRVLDGRAAMTVCGDWAVGGPTADAGITSREDGTRGQNWDQMPMPGTTDGFLFTADAFVAPANNPTPQTSRQWLRYCGSAVGQRRFCAEAGSIPLRSGVSADALPAFTRQQYQRYLDADARVPSLIDGLVLSPADYTPYLTAMFRFVNEWDAEGTATELRTILQG